MTEQPLPVASPGTTHCLLVHRFGTAGARPKAYLQAGLHADEIPGLLVLHHLIGCLAEAAQSNAVRGEVVVVPFANPLGLGQRLNGTLMGRYELGGGGNFNRNFPDLTDAVAAKVDGKLGTEAGDNVVRIRTAMRGAVTEQVAQTEIEALRLALLGLAVDADIVLDLHCDSESVVHLFVGTQLWPDAAELSAQIGSRATLLAVDSGGGPFDEACSRPWHALGERFGAAAPVPPACLAATVELRGSADVDDACAAADAANLFCFLQRRAVVAGDPGPLPAALCEATPLEGVDFVVAPSAGVVSYRKAPGDRVEAGETVAELVDPGAADPSAARTELKARTCGILLGRHLMKFARRGERVCKIAGRQPLPGRRQGALLDD